MWVKFSEMHVLEIFVNIFSLTYTKEKRRTIDPNKMLTQHFMLKAFMISVCLKSVCIYAKEFFDCLETDIRYFVGMFRLDNGVSNIYVSFIWALKVFRYTWF